MPMYGGISDFLEKIIKRAREANGKIIGQDGEMIKSKLAKNDKHAYINKITEDYLKHKPIEKPPKEFNITSKDIIKEISIREIEKIIEN